MIMLTCLVLCFAAFVSSAPAFHMRQDFIVTAGTAYFGDVAIRLEIDTASLMAGANPAIESCAELRFYQAGFGAHWLDYWYESGCNSPQTRVWVKPTFARESLTIEMHYQYMDTEGVHQDPGTASGTELFYSGKFIAMSTAACSGGWTYESKYENRFIRVRKNVNENSEDGSWDGHVHTTGSFFGISQTSTYDRRDEGGTLYSAAELSHRHPMSELTCSSPKNTALPPFLSVIVCSNPLLDMTNGMVTPMAGNWGVGGPMSPRWRRFDELDGKLPRGASSESYDGSGGGDYSHYHTLTGPVAGSTANSVCRQGSSHLVARDTHEHPRSGVNTDPVSFNNLPKRFACVFAQVNHADGGENYDLNFAYFASGMPPMNSYVQVNADNIYLFGWSTIGTVIEDKVTGHHSVDITLQSAETTPSFNGYWDSSYDEEWHLDHHEHPESTYSTAEPFDQDDLDRIEVRLIKLDSRFHAQGISPQTPVTLIPTYTCGGIYWQASGVCDGRGTCVSQDNCDCDPDPMWGLIWTGPTCDIGVSCYTRDYDDPQVCNSHGHCHVPGVCTCDIPQPGYGVVFGGDECDIPAVCAGYQYDHASACAGLGNCTYESGSPACSCPTHTWGAFCNNTNKCGGYFWMQPEVCTWGRGDCRGVADDICVCDPGYGGQFCEHFVCGGILANGTSTVCSGNGDCVGINNCTCDIHPVLGDVWSGTDCEIPTTCVGKIHTNPDACHAGECHAPGVCVCDAGHIGVDCAEAQCNGVGATNQSFVCSNHGTCIDSATPECLCDEHHYGVDCENEYYCYGHVWSSEEACSNITRGECRDGMNNCICIAGRYAGSECELSLCNDILSNMTTVCNSYGNCTDYDTCSCDEMYTGQFCQEPIQCGGIPWTSSESCNLGTCEAGGICRCDPDHTSSLCDEPLCFGIKRTNDSVCSGFGTCEDGNPPVCVCDDFHTDAECQTKIRCGAYDFDNNDTCNRHGFCRYAHNNCTCEAGIWGGQLCETPFCNGLIGSDKWYVCNGSGNCTDYNKCECDSLHLGEWCGEDESCYDYKWSDHYRVCRGRGLCVKKDVCECYDGYSGDECGNAGCFGFNSSDVGVCNGHGRCWRVDMCMCEDRWYGQKCEETLPEKTVYVKGMTTHPQLQFFLPYIAPVRYMMEQESPIHHTEFPCNARLFNYSGDVCGKDATCVWVPGENENFTAGLNVTIRDPKAAVYVPGSLSKLSVVLLTSFSDLFRGSMQVQSLVEAPVEIDETDYGGIAAGIVIPLLLVGAVLAVFFIVVIVVVTRAQRKKQREAEESLMSRNRELLEVQEMYLAETEKMAERMRKLAEGGQGTGEILRLDEMGPANNVMVAEEVRDILWGYNCVCHSATWGGRKFISKILTFDDLYVAEDFRKAIVSFGTLPPHPNIRCLPAYYEKDLGGDDSVTSSFAPKLNLPIIQGTGDEKTPLTEPEEKEAKTTLPVPTVGALVESCAHGDVIMHLDERRSEARQLLSGVEVRTGVRLTQKVQWLIQIVSGLRFMFTHGVPCEEFNTKCIVIDSNEDVKLDSNYARILKKDLIKSPFAAPELVRKYAKEIGEELRKKEEEEEDKGAEGEAEQEGEGEVADDVAASQEDLGGAETGGVVVDQAEELSSLATPGTPTPGAIVIETPGQVKTPGEQDKKEDDDEEGKFLSYSFGMVAYCIFVESSNPFCFLPRKSDDDLVEYGRLAALDENFRPTLELPDWVLPTWSQNILDGCWKADPEERVGLDVVESQLTAVLGFEEHEEVGAEGDDDVDETVRLHAFEEWK